MSFELAMLAASCVLCLARVVIFSHAASVVISKFA
jgi:ribosomal protein S27E